MEDVKADCGKLQSAFCISRVNWSGMIGLLHTTQTVDGTGGTLARTMVQKGTEPHAIYEPGIDKEYVIHSPYERAKSLYNAKWGVETNNRERDGRAGCDVWQVEIVAFAEDVKFKGDEWYANLKRYLQIRGLRYGIPYVFPFRFAKSYEDAVNTRLSFQAWNDPNLAGWLGHCHVPENVHWDPGNIDLGRLMNAPRNPINFLRGDGTYMYVQVTDTFNAGQIWYLFWDGPPTSKQLYRKHLTSQWQALQHRYESELLHLPWDEIDDAIEVV